MYGMCCRSYHSKGLDMEEKITWLDETEVRHNKSYKNIMDTDRTDWYKRKVHTKKKFS